MKYFIILIKKTKIIKYIINKIVMSKKEQDQFLQFKEYPSTLARYSNSDQLQAHQYKSIIQSTIGQGYYQKQFPSMSDAELTRLNANVPVKNTVSKIYVDNKPINVYDQFWQYKQNGGTIFTDWVSSGISNLNTDISISHMPLYGDPKLHDPTLILSNTNNIRNNLQRYGKEYLTTTNMLNSIAFDNGISYQSGYSSPIRTGMMNEENHIQNSNFSDKEHGDLYSRQIKYLDVRLPPQFTNTSRTNWVYINPAFIRLNERLDVFHSKLQFGIFDIDSMKLTGESCLTENFNITPKGLNGPVDVLNDKSEYPPLSNPSFYNGSRSGEKEGIGSNMYCSANTNFVAMPINNIYPDLDTSINVMPGNNSTSLGTVMSQKLKIFIQNDLFNLNRSIILMKIHEQNKHINVIKTGLEDRYPHIFKDRSIHSLQKGKKVTIYELYMSLSEDNKYKWLFNQQRNFASINEHYPEVEIFINNLSIFKFSGNNINNPLEKGSVLLREINDILGLDKDSTIQIDTPGCFLLLPTMVSEDLFGIRENIPTQFSGSVDQINNSMKDLIDYEINEKSSGSYSPNINNPDECITHLDPYNFELNATNCAFRDSSGKWIQRQNPNFLPNMFNDPNNLNNDISHLVNPYAGANPYNAPTTF